MGTIPNPASPSAIKASPPSGLMGKGSRLGGMAPRQTTAPANTMAPPVPPAGGMEQKTMAPPSPSQSIAVATPPPQMIKMNSAKEEANMTAMGVRPVRLQDMLKTAMAQTADKVNVSLEAARRDAEPVKTASREVVEGAVDHEYALKLASAIEYVALEFSKEASAAENKQGIGRGPNHLEVLEAKAEGQMPAHQGQGKHVVPMNPGTEAGAGEKLETTMNNPAGFHSTQTTAMTAGKGKTAAAIREAAAKLKTAGEKEEKKETEGMAEAKAGLDKAEEAHEAEKKAGINALAERMRKVAEDAINPAKISAGPAVEPDTNASGESGGAPVGGAPQGPTGLVASNESAINYKPGPAHSPRKAELKEYFSEPALSSSTDKTLGLAFAHTGEAGTKFGSAAVGASTKVAAARAVLAKLAEGKTTETKGA